MGNCRYCGKPAGILRSQHRECAHKHQQGKEQILAVLRDATKAENVEPTRIEATARQISSSSFIDEPSLREVLITGWSQAVETAFDDGVLSEKQEEILTELMRHFRLTQEDLETSGAYFRVVKGSILRQVLEGKLPRRIAIEGPLPFNFQKSETLVWLFQNVKYLEERTRSHFVGGSRGVGIRVAKGVYVRAGAFKGERVQTTETIHADTGLMGVTTNHLYFSGPSKRFRIKYDKVVAFEPYSDAIGVQRDAASAKPQTFVTGDGWFTYNLITNLARM